MRAERAIRGITIAFVVLGMAIALVVIVIAATLGMILEGGERLVKLIKRRKRNEEESKDFLETGQQ